MNPAVTRGKPYPSRFSYRSPSSFIARPATIPCPCACCTGTRDLHRCDAPTMTIDTQAFNNDVGADREVEPSFHLVRVVVERAARELTRLCELGAVSQLLVLDRACSFSFNQRPKSSPPAHTCILDFGPTSVEVRGYLLVRGGTGVRSDGALCNRMMNQWGILTR